MNIPQQDMADKLDIVERLNDAFTRTAVCHCGSGMGGCDNHDFAWNPDEDTQMLSDAKHEIITLRERCKRAERERGELGQLLTVAVEGRRRDGTEEDGMKMPEMKMLGLWHPASDLPGHGIEVLTIIEGDERIEIGWWDKEIRGWITYTPNGTRHRNVLWWCNLPPKPTPTREPKP